MKLLKLLLFIQLLLSFQIMIAQPNAFARYKTYDGNDLGITYLPEKTTIKIWAPTAEYGKWLLYSNGLEGVPTDEIRLLPNGDGTLSGEIVGNQLNKYYTVQVSINGKWYEEVPDPYAKAVGANGKRGMIVDLAMTNPQGWENDKSPMLQSVSAAIIYELHVRDATIATSAKQKGRFLGLTEMGLKNSAGQSVGLEHIKELGVTHVHLLPFFDFASIDETARKPKYNWGYDPQNFNAPEGSYSTAASDGNTRIKELKQLVKTFHDNGLRVVMDVVYNHVYAADNFSFQQIAPNYFFRQTREGKLSNASACGNETASDREMVRKFIVESVKYWVREYHIDGFRFDLMAIHDIETMNLIAKELRKIKPDILLYGEGWTAGDSPLLESERSLKKYAYRLDDIAVFSDDMRDGLKGSVFEHKDKGFVSGKADMEESVKFGIVGATRHPQVNYDKINYSKEPYCKKPAQMIAYAECHDNHTLWDRLLNSNPEASEDERVRMFLLAETIVLTSQGIPFIHAGAEFCRTKQGVENSFESPDEINQIDWERKARYTKVFDFMKQLIAFRKAHPAFHLPTQDMVQNHLEFLAVPSPQIIAYQLKGKPNGEKYKQILLIFNANKEAISFNLPKAKWRVALNDWQWENGERKIIESQISVAAQSATILFVK
jgi:pullulanase